LEAHLKLPDGLKNETALPYPKATIAEALRFGLGREERSSVDDELMRSIYLGLSDYQPERAELARRVVSDERARLLEELKPFPERPVSDEFKHRLRDLFSAERRQVA
jgi:hypothetical protein